MVTYLWTPKARHCTRVTEDKALYKTGMYHRNFKLAERKKIKKTIHHLVTDYAHILPKLHCPWDDKLKNEINPSLLYHGLKASDVTLKLRPPAPAHSAHPDLKDATPEWHGRQAQDVTEIYTYMCRGQRPPSRDYWHGREATDISNHLRIIPPIAIEGEAQEFYGRPKSDVTDYNIFPPWISETGSRSEAARPLGKCPPGPMADYVTLVHDQHGRLLQPQPLSLPKTPTKRHDLQNQESLKPGGGGILSQIVAGNSRSEAKLPLGKCPPGVMADYMELKRDEEGKVIHPPSKIFPTKPPGWKLKDTPPLKDLAAERAMRYSNERLHPLGKVPDGVMVDYEQVNRPPHKHTTDGLWSPPTIWPKDTMKLDCEQISSSKHAKFSPWPMSQSEAACNAADTLQAAKQKLQIDSSLQLKRRDEKVCTVHDGLAPQPCVANIKWGESGEPEPVLCKMLSSTKSCLSTSANASPTCYGSMRNCDPIKHDPRMARPSSPCSLSSRSGDGMRPNTSHLKRDCSQEKKAVEYNAWTAAKKPLSYSPSGNSVVGSAKGSCASIDSSGSKASQTSKVRRAKKNRIISPIMTPEHYQFPYFGHSKTYVTDPAVSPNLTPIGRRSMRLPGQKKIPFAKVASDQDCSKPKCGLLEKPNSNPHVHDNRTSWFGRTKTYVTDSAISPNLTPPNRG